MTAPLDELILSAYRPRRSLRELLQPLLDALVAQLSLSTARLRLGEVELTSGLPQGGQAGSTREHALGISYASDCIGELRVWLPLEPAPGSAASPLSCAGEAATEAALTFCEGFARRCAHLAKRYECQAWARARLGRPLMLVGLSEALQRLEAFVERASQSLLPVLLRGEFGTEKTQVAMAIHCCGARRDGAFVEINCANPVGEPAQWFQQARGGSLFLNGLDELDRTLQAQLPKHMHSRLNQWFGAPDALDVRVIASTTADPAELVREGRLSRQLLAELDFLSMAVAPLRERPADVQPLLVDVLERHGFDPQRLCTEALVRACKRHDWPENLFELERVVARLAVMNQGRPIEASDLASHAPWLLGPALDRRTAEPAANPPQVLDDGWVPASVAAKPPPASQDHWVRCVITGDAAELGRLHGALAKALMFLSAHYAEPLSLAQLAAQAHVSPSHLGYLFRSVLRTTFKPLLQRVRIEKAKEMLGADTQLRITEVAFSVGFGDLSHFEKSFRRIVGRSPREFRRGVAA